MAQPQREGAVGSFDDYLKKAQGISRASTLFGEKTEATGEPSIKIPRWFKITGVRSFEIDTGLGIVKCYDGPKAVAAAEKTRDALPRPAFEKKPQEVTSDFERRREEGIQEWEATRQQHYLLEYCFRLVRSIPEDWPVEEDVTLGEVVLKAGDFLPQPSAIANLSIEGKETYLSLMPKSLPAQVIGGAKYLSIPFLTYEEKIAGDPTPGPVPPA